jgi:hypothetical protein
VRHHNTQFAPDLLRYFGGNGHSAAGDTQDKWGRFKSAIPGSDERFTEPGSGIDPISIPHATSVLHLSG